MVKDNLGRLIIPGNHVFYHGSLYEVQRTTEGTPEAKDPGHYVHLQYAGEGYELVRLKRVYSDEVCLVDVAAAHNYIRAQEIKRAAHAAQWPSNNG
jgi:hypothetical protein